MKGLYMTVNNLIELLKQLPGDGNIDIGAWDVDSGEIFKLIDIGYPTRVDEPVLINMEKIT